MKTILDCDPGHDDAIAMMLAHGDRRVDLLAVTTVAGNCSLGQASDNAARVATAIGLTDIPIAAGHVQPLARVRRHAEHIHGSTGIDGPALPPARVRLADRHAVNLMVQLVMDHPPGEVTLIGTGPSTNLAAAVRREPAIARRVRQVILMAGASRGGNITPVAEFNVFADPEAADIVLRSPWDVTLVGLDVTHRALATNSVRDRLRAVRTTPARIAADLIDFVAGTYVKHEGMDSPPLHDPCAVAYGVDSSLVETRLAKVDVELSGRYTTGMTVTDFRNRRGRTRIAVDLDVEGFWSLVVNAVRDLGDPLLT